jgi:DNA-binding transcriptional ArsR family regulator
LAKSEASVTDLAKPFGISLPAVSKHLKVLQTAGLLTRERQGRIHRLRLAPKPLFDTLEWMERYRPLWETQLDSLSSYLEREKKVKSR